MRLLIVDDDHKNLKLLKAFVADLGDCEAVEGGQKAISAFKKAWEDWRPFNLVLLDILMPESDGKKVLSKIRNIENDKKNFGSTSRKNNYGNCAIRKRKWCLIVFRGGAMILS